MSQEKLLFTHKPLATQNNCVSAESYQNLIRKGGRNPKTVGIQAFFGFSELFPLKEWKRQQTLLYFGQGKSTDGYCFTQNEGELLNPNTITGYIRDFGKRYNLPGMHPHALRHTMATLSIANGADVVSVSKKLGHCNPSVTLNIYSHANEEAQRRATEVLADALYNNRKAN